MFQNLIIPNKLSLDNFLSNLNIDFYLTKPQVKHYKDIMKAMILPVFNGKIADVAHFASQNHRTSITRFLSSDAWDESNLFRSFRSMVVDLIWSKSKETGKPIYFIIDDTISEKTKPSSKATNPIEKCSFHNSHLKGKTVYGHQILVSLLSCDGLVLPYSIDIYDKNIMSKIEISKNLITSLPMPENKGYVVCDSWYSCKEIFNQSLNAGYKFIGALKTNRVIYPEGSSRLGTKLTPFAKSLSIDDFDLVTVNNQEYYIYHYIGRLKDRKKASIVLSYPKDSFQKDGALKTFISLDFSLTALEILNKYVERWDIEPFFRDCKTYLGLSDYQVRSEQSIKRFLIIILMNYTYCKLYSGKLFHFNTGIKKLRNDTEKSKIIWIFNSAINGESIETIFEHLKIA